jgi:hypothetical protein
VPRLLFECNVEPVAHIHSTESSQNKSETEIKISAETLFAAKINISFANCSQENFKMEHKP